MPDRAAPELVQLGGSVDEHITHMKPGQSGAVMREIGALGSGHRIQALVAGQVMRLG